MNSTRMIRPDSPDIPRTDPCFQVNPYLWAFFCHTRNRPIWPASTNWTEADVVQALDEAEMRPLEAFQRLGWGVMPNDPA